MLGLLLLGCGCHLFSNATIGQTCEDVGSCDGSGAGVTGDSASLDTAVDSDLTVDDDGDGFSEEEGDCDDADPAVSPDAEEVCDDIDNDCDDKVDGNDSIDTNGDGSDEDCPIGSIGVVYVYDSSYAVDIDDYLDMMGFASDIIARDDITSSSLNGFDLLVVSGEATTISGSWTEVADLVLESGIPVMGMGVDGYYLFGEMGLETGYPNGEEVEQTSLDIADASHAVFSTPYNLSKDASMTAYVTLSSTAVIGVTQFDDVKLLAYSGGTSVQSVLSVESEIYLAWGFSSSPISMSLKGKKLFTNAVVYLLDQ